MLSHWVGKVRHNNNNNNGYNKFWDAIGDLSSLAWTPVVKKPIVHDGSAGADTLIADLCLHGSEGHRPRHCLTSD